MVRSNARTVAITTLGCKTNQFESAAMVEALDREGFRIVPFEEIADIYVINTCTVTAKTDAESRKLIRKATRLNPQAFIAVTGCYAQVAFDELRDMPGVNLVLGNREKKGIVGFLKEISATPRVVVSDIAGQTEEESHHLESFAEHTRAFLQVQNGCDSNCSYCIVPKARGRNRSVPLDEVIGGIGLLAARGYRELVLTGIHLGAYGLDLTPATSLLKLLEICEEGKLVERLRVGSIEPTEVSSEMIRLFARAKTLCHHLHIPLQSGSDAVLARMNRNYTTALFKTLLAELAANIPDVCIGTDIIAGFPGETEEEFAEGYRFLESLPLAYLHVFPFSPRKGTPAATMPGQVTSSVVKERARELRRLSERKKRDFQKSFIGRELQVLVQGSEAGICNGLSRNYLPVILPGAAALGNTEIIARVTRVERGMVYAEMT